MARCSSERTVVVKSARGIAAADKSGSSDPYCCVLWNGMEIGRTSWKEQTLEPVWDERFKIKIPDRGGKLVR